MRVIAHFCIVPIGVGVSLTAYIAECEKVFQEMGLSHSLHAYGTNVEGEWDEVFTALRRCHDRLHEMGAPRISTTVKLGTRTDKEQTIAAKVESVERNLGA